MTSVDKPLRVLYSFPHKLGATRICATAWHQVDGLAAAGADVLAFPGVLHKPLAASVKVRPTLARGKLRIPYKVLGRMRALALHDFIVARRLEKLADRIDIIHTWPLGALLTLKTAAKLGIPTVLERPNAHTRFAYEVVQRECERLGVPLPPNHEHAFNPRVLAREEEEYELANWLLCPSDFVARTFIDKGFRPEKLLRHQYGFDHNLFFPGENTRENDKGLTVLFAGGCAPRKGLHYALDAWLQSEARKAGRFLIAGAFVPGYAERLSSQLSHPSVKMLGHRTDIPDLMRQSHVLILPSIEEGSALVTSEARGCGCVLLVSDAAGAICEHGKNALVHPVGDVQMLTQHLDLISGDRRLLLKFSQASLETVDQITWTAAGQKLEHVYRQARRKLAKSGVESDENISPCSRSSGAINQIE
jgi:glycosyltransferase involved in cell wall biosynthesis